MRPVETPPSLVEDDRWRERCSRMVDAQIESRGVRDPRVLAAMRAVPRHRFVPDELASAAYEDRPLPIGRGQTISQPYIVAAMTAALDVHPAHRVLEVGTGCGYQAAILARLARHVVTIERVPELAERARVVLAALGISNVDVVVGDGSLGYEGASPADRVFDRILVTAAAPSVPDALVRQLAADGVLVIPVGSRTTQRLSVIRRAPDGRVQTTTRDPCVFVPLIGAAGWDA